jgi:xanthosine utilization system XapX-like protein
MEMFIISLVAGIAVGCVNVWIYRHNSQKHH